MSARTLLSLILPCLLGACAAAPSPPPGSAVLYLLDKSGGMAGGFDDLKRACVVAAQELHPSDYVAVVAFDFTPKWILPFTRRQEAGKLADTLGRLFADGGTRLYPALEMSIQAFEKLPAEPPLRRRIVVISDGNTPDADFQGLIENQARKGVSVSTLCVSSGNFDAVLMARLAEWGGGRFKFTNRTANVPQLLVQETRQFVGE
jgi:Mg-chelatase subunit ChlD